MLSCIRVCSIDAGVYTVPKSYEAALSDIYTYMLSSTNRLM